MKNIRLFRWTFVLLVILGLISTWFWSSTGYVDSEYNLNSSISDADIAVAAITTVGYAFGIWLLLFSLEIISYLIRKFRENKSQIQSSTKQILNTGSQKLKHFSDQVMHDSAAKGSLSKADELRKWAALRDDGLITEEEFQHARKDLVAKIGSNNEVK